MFQDIIFPITFRKYQNEMILTFERLQKKNDKRFHFVAPPGSGKTILGLELIRRLGQKAVVFSPNSAIQIQWIDKLQNLTELITISSDPFSEADIISLTYQAITVKDHKTGKLHQNAKQILEHLKANYPIIILDECHHLVAYWAEILNQLIQEESYVIGLTATPPLDRGQRAINAYLGVVGEVDYQVPLPPIIKEGNLAPFQDLVYFIEPTETEMEQLDKSNAKYHDVIQRLHDLTPPLIPIHIWTEQRLEEFRDKNDNLIPFDELLTKEPDLCIALARYTLMEMNKLPFSVMMLDEMEEEPTITDIMLVLEDYALNHLYLEPEGKSFYSELKSSLKDIGFLLTRNGIQSLDTGIPTILGLSHNKMIAMKRILTNEMINMQEDLRCLILTDYELGKHLNGTSAISVMKIITSDEEVDPVNPILITGSTVLVDDDLLPMFEHHANNYVKENNLNIKLSSHLKEGYYEIKGSGSDWGTKNYILMITRMLEEGVTKCLIGTRSLLGEGWDCIKLNTLIDLTLVSTFVSVNQIRGRTIRSDSDNQVKVANNWDIVSITGGFDRGFYDFERFKKKHAHFYGLSEDDVIEKGIGHVHPLLTNANMATILSSKDEINKIMFERAHDRFSIYKRWKIGEPYSGYETVSIEIVPQKENIQYEIPKMKAEKTKEYRFFIKERDDQLSSIKKEYKQFSKKKYKYSRKTREYSNRSLEEWNKLKWNKFPLIQKKQKRFTKINTIGLLIALFGSIFVFTIGLILAHHFGHEEDGFLYFFSGILLSIGYLILSLFIRRKYSKKAEQDFKEIINQTENDYKEAIDQAEKALESTVDQANNGLVEDNPIEESLMQFAKVLFHTLKETADIEESITEKDIIINHRDDGSYRILLQNSAKSKSFTQSLAELLSPLQNQRYIIERKRLNVPHTLEEWQSGKMEYSVENYHPIPSILGNSRKKADIFKSHWNNYISPGKVIYTRRGEGKNIIQQFFRQKQIPIHQKKKEIWM